MKLKTKLRITAPGSTANLGPGFDSIGLALNCYTTIEVQESNSWNFIALSPELKGIPEGKENLIYKAADFVAEAVNQTLPPCQVEVTSDIPLSRGLGSSAAAIMVGIELANQLLKLELSDEEKARYGSLYEGHPDNAAASLYGGLVIGSHREDDTDVIQMVCPDVDIIVYIPAYELKTEKARRVLPDQFSYKQAVQASSVSNVLVASLMQGRWDVAGKMMQKDLFHQPYRNELVPEIKDVIAIAVESGAYGAALSGAGPTIICFAPVGKGEIIQRQLKTTFQNARIEKIQADYQGLTVSYINAEQKQPF